MRSRAPTCLGLLLADLAESLSICERSVVVVDGTPAYPAVIRQFLKDNITGEFMIEVEALETDGPTGCSCIVSLDEISPVLRH
jgi:hypothetical protein